MNKILTAVVVVALLGASGAFANGPGEGMYRPNVKKCNGKLNCNKTDNNVTGNKNTVASRGGKIYTGDVYNGRVGDTNNTRNVDRSVTNIDRSRNNTATGGKGGSATGGSVGNVRATGGKVRNSGNSDNRNRNIVNGGDQRTKVDASSRNKLSNDSNSRSAVKDSGNSTNNINIGNVGYSDGDGEGGGSSFSPTANNNGHNGNNNGNNGHNGNNGNLDNVGNASVNADGALSGNTVSPTATNDGNNTNVDASDHSTTTYKAADIPVATAYAPALTSSNDTCMGSTSIGGQGVLFGLSFGTTWTDNDCITRKDARFIHNAGHRTVALSLMCGKESVRAAVARAGTPEQIAACAITADEIESYRAEPIIVKASRHAPSHVAKSNDK